MPPFSCLFLAHLFYPRCRPANFTGSDKIMEGKIMILSFMILSSQGWIRKRLLVPPSRAEVRSSLPTGRSWQQHGGSRRLRFKALRWSSFGGPQKGRHRTQRARHLDDPPQPRLDLRRLFRFHQRMESNAFPALNFSPLPQLKPVIPQKTGCESDSPTI